MRQGEEGKEKTRQKGGEREDSDRKREKEACLENR